jgi:squalene-associated FAD-dependent desaturase
MKKTVVIGSGFAGLTAASYLSNNNHKVQVLEASPKPGGRAYSFKDKQSDVDIDNGQHILMGCYKETLEFLKLIGADSNLIRQKNLSIKFVKKNFEICELSASHLFYPLNLLNAVLNYSAISFYEKVLFLKFFGKLYFYSDNELKYLSVIEWLRKEKQSDNLIKAFWEILVIGALNADISKVSAKIFADILKEIFFRGNDAASIILPSMGLSSTYCCDALEFIENRNGEVSFSELVTDLVINDNQVVEIITSARVIKDFDFVVSAVPLYSLKKFLNGNNFLNNLSLDYSSILTVHLFLKKNRFENTFYGLIGSPVQWVFNKGTHLTIVISNADVYMETSKEKIYDMVLNELKEYILLGKDEVESYNVIKEKRATFIPSNNILDRRPGSITPYKNLFLAGDWTDTGLPATIEGAVKSGNIAVRAVLSI